MKDKSNQSNTSPNIRRLYFKDTSFAQLMNKRIYNVLLFSSHYDAFLIEEDGRIDEQVFNEYHSLSLRHPPRFTLVSTLDDAYHQLQQTSFDLIIIMPNSEHSEPFAFANQIKQRYPDIPMVALTPFANDIAQQLDNEDLSSIDYVFCWLGNPDVLLAIIKMIEDRMNVADDVASVGVQTIILIEDSIRYYSYFLPLIYKFVFTQSLSFMTEALNLHEKMLRMRGRPKVLLARSYEEAIELYDRYSSNTLGIITDMSFPLNGKEDPFAGQKFCNYVRSKDIFLPIIMESSELSNEHVAQNFNGTFINKNSKRLNEDLSCAIKKQFGFGNLCFIDPSAHKEVAVVHNLKELQKSIFEVPANSLLYHVSRNEISRWLYSRAMFPLAEFLKQISIQELNDVNEARHIIFDAIIQYRKIKNRGIIAEFERDKFDTYSNFARIGQGSLGGKARGLAFMNAMMKRNEGCFDEFSNVQVNIPRTVVICTDIYDTFLETNQLMPVGLSDIDDDDMLQAFLDGNLPDELVADLTAFLQTVNGPIAVRSSSLMEDSHYHPFAGTYSTYMVAQMENPDDTLHHLCQAIKGVYASTFFRNSKSYLAATSSVVEEEKMAIVLQEVVGRQYGNRYYPSFSGVGRSLNFYPIAPEKPEDGVCNIALGLGKYIVDGGNGFRFCPRYPGKALQNSTLKLALNSTQTQFMALNLKNNEEIKVNEAFNLETLNVKDADTDGSLRYIASTLDLRSGMLVDHTFEPGRRVITFANILKHDAMPLAGLLTELLKMGQHEMGCPVEIEFSVNLSYDQKIPHEFYLLQMRPIAKNKRIKVSNIEQFTPEQLIMSSEHTLGYGITGNITDIVYVKQDSFDNADTKLMATEIEMINKQLVKQERYYLLAGPGRWGSSDPWLGIPVEWSQISGARAIAEIGLNNFRIEPSQGTHFFQNVTSFKVSYFTINPFIKEGLFDEEYLNSLEAEHESKYIRHIHLKNPITTIIDGVSGKGVVLKPDVKFEWTEEDKKIEID